MADPDEPQQAPTPQPRQRRHLGAGIAASLIGQIGGLAAAAVTSIVIARMFGADGTGVFVLVVNTFWFLVKIFELGIPGGLTYLVSHRRWRMTEAFRATLLTSFALGLLGAALGLGLYELISDTVFKGLSFTMAAMVSVAVPFGLSANTSAAFAISRDHYEAYGVFKVLPNSAIAVFAIALAIPFGIKGAVIGFAIAWAVVALASAIWVARFARATERAEPTTEQAERPLREALHFGVQSWGADVLALVNARVDIFILNAYALTADVGVYSVAVTVTQLALMIPRGFNAVILPRAAELDAAVRRGEISASESDATAIKACRHGVLQMLPTAVVLALVLPLVPIIYGSEFDDSVMLGLILLPGVVINGLTQIVNPISAARGYVRYPLFVRLITTPVAVALYFLLIPSLEETGAALASTLVYLCITTLAVLFFRRSTGIGPRQALVPSRAELADYRDALSRVRTYLRDRRGR